jgi:hypothetical protein
MTRTYWTPHTATGPHLSSIADIETDPAVSKVGVVLNYTTGEPR